MGGHGYSAYSRVTRLRDDHDPTVTFEVWEMQGKD